MKNNLIHLKNKIFWKYFDLQEKTIGGREGNILTK